MSYDSIQVANAFLELARKSDSTPLSNMQLQKLVFLAQGFSLALGIDPVTYHNIHAWQWGPVLPKIYKAFSSSGNGPILANASNSADPVDQDSEAYDVIKQVWEAYGHMTGAQLSRLTHEKDSPWDLAWKRLPYSIIDHESMRDFYQKQLLDA